MPAQVGRADLLRALCLGRIGPLALDHTDAVWWGYVPPEPDVIVVEDVSETLELPFRRFEPPATSTPSPARARSALRMPEAWVAERLDKGSGESPDAPERSTLLTELELQPLDEPQAAYQDLLPLPRLARPLAAQLRRPQAAGVNIAALLQSSTRRQWPRRLPRLVRQTWPATLVVMLDVSTDLFPYRYDMYRVVALLQALVPRAQLRVMTGAHGPFGPWPPFHRQAAPADTDDGVRPESGSTYLLVSDLGLLRPASEMAQAWKAWLAGVQARQCACVALAPVGADDVGSTLAALVRLLRWSPDSRLQPERGRPDTGVAAVDGSSESALRELLVCLSATLRMDPPLLRALRQNSSAPQDASLEGRLWAHPDVLSTTYACMRQGRIQPQQAAALRLQSGARWSALETVCDFHHAHWPLGMRLVEGMRQLTTHPMPDSMSLERMRAEIHCLAHTLDVDEGNRAALDATADYVLSHVPAEARPLLGTALDALAQATGRPTGPRQRWCLLQRGQQLRIVPVTDTRPPSPGVVLCSDLGQAASGELVRIAQPRQPPQYLALPVQGMLVLPPMKTGAGIVLGGEETQLLRRQRTRGVWGWRQSEELVETLDLPWLADLAFPNEGVVRGFAFVRSQKGGEIRVGIDRDEYGVFLELLPMMERGKVFPSYEPLRFRYLEPATYLQGSPQGTGHYNEHPQHSVTLSRGLWLAETPCTQGLWQAVMGKNPSDFTGSKDAIRRPVENVSWDDVGWFLQALQRLLPPGCEAVLPNESQWEYACRAGTRTQYWWGDEADDSRANWNKQHGGTTLVGNYPPNPWGLYDMHGNVLEWCADGWCDYTDSSARDPEGPGDGYERVVRGGSWLFRHADARAASRSKRPRWYAFRSVGFRFALRSPKAPEARPGGPGASRRGGAAGGRTVGADAPAAEPPRRDADDARSPE